jgi:hypothetical protein
MGRLNIRFNTDIDLTSRLAIRFDASFANITRNIRNDGAPESYDEGTPTAPGFLAYAKSPFMSPYSYGHDESGKGRFSDSHFDLEEESYLSEAMTNYPNYNWKLGNPAAINEYGDAEVKNRFENSMLNLTITPKYEFNSHLFVSEHFSYNLVNTNEQYYIPVNGADLNEAFSFTSDETGYIGIHEEPDYTNMTASDTFVEGIKLFADYANGIVKGTVGE